MPPADADDPDHAVCDELLAERAGELVTPVPVVIECAWLIESRLGFAAEAAFLRSVTTGDIGAENLTPTDWESFGKITTFELLP